VKECIGSIFGYTEDSIEKAFFSNEEVQTSEKNAIETAN